MKKIVSVVLVLMMTMGVSEGFAYNESFDNIFDNPVFEIVAEIGSEPGQPSEGAELIYTTIDIDDEYEGPENAFIETKLYSDGAFTREELFKENVYSIKRATRYYPAYLEGDTTGKYVGYTISDTVDGIDYYNDIYLIDTTGDEITKTLIGSMVPDYDSERHESIYTLYSASEENGTIVRTPLHDAPLTQDEMDVLEKGTTYEDGLKFSKLENGGFEGISGFTDINGKVYFEDYQISYFNYFYNLGYLVTSTNNGDTLDYSNEDYEKQRVYETCVKNVFTDETYNFYDMDIVNILDSGYAIIYFKDEARNEMIYLAKIKKHAVVKVMVDGKKVLFDVLPTIVEGRTLVPLRAIFESLGADIVWDEATQTVTAQKGDLSIALTIGSDKMTVGGEVKTLDVSAQVVDGRTLVPVRAISEAFGCNVAWDEEMQTVVIEN